jgi:arylsulfatase A-like enzyme
MGYADLGVFGSDIRTPNIDALRERRFQTLKQANIIPATSTLPPRWEQITPWDDLGREQQNRESRKLELYAAMVENLDGHVGRLLAYLKANNLYDDTLVVFMSDNGPAASDFLSPGALYRLHPGSL